MQNDTTESQNTFGEKVKVWLEENLRLILSVLIVLAIAGGIYSYSQRTQSPTITSTDEEISTEAPQDETTDTTTDIATTEPQEETAAPNDTQTTQEASKPQDQQVTSAETSKETEQSFIVTAQRGDGSTHLARKALANYLEKNPDSALTKEHKIYIEDYLRKHDSKGAVKIGASVEFSKDAIKAAIEKSKQLNDAQLKNLKKFSARVSSL